MAFRGEQSSGGEDGLEDLTKAIIEEVLRMPGNELCCDCGAAGAFCRSPHVCLVDFHLGALGIHCGKNLPLRVWVCLQRPSCPPNSPSLAQTVTDTPNRPPSP